MVDKIWDEEACMAEEEERINKFNKAWAEMQAKYTLPPRRPLGAEEEAAMRAHDAAAAKVFEAETPARDAADAAAEKVRADYYAAVKAELAHADRLHAPACYKVIDRAHDHRRRIEMNTEAGAVYDRVFQEEKARLGL